MPKELTDLQEKFLNALFGEAKGSYAKAMRIAGYAPSTNSHVIVTQLNIKKKSTCYVTNFVYKNLTKAFFVLLNSRF